MKVLELIYNLVLSKPTSLRRLRDERPENVRREMKDT
jgi:hypothetical protein